MGQHDPRYNRDDFLTPARIRSTNYDRLRSAGASHEFASRVANESVDKTLKKIDQGPGFRPRGELAPVGSEPAATRSPFRVRFDFESQDAGITLSPRSP